MEDNRDFDALARAKEKANRIERERLGIRCDFWKQFYMAMSRDPQATPAGCGLAADHALAEWDKRWGVK